MAVCKHCRCTPL